MLLTLEIEDIKLGLGKQKTGAEITLSDTERPRCLVPFSYYITDVPAFEARFGCKLTDLKFKPVAVAVTQMGAAQMGAGIKLQGDLGPVKPNNK
jgi:hypothetical protein